MIMHGMVGFKINQVHPPTPHSPTNPLHSPPTHSTVPPIPQSHPLIPQPHSLTPQPHPPTPQPLPLHSPTLSFHSPAHSLNSPPTLSTATTHTPHTCFHTLPITTVTVPNSCPCSLGSPNQPTATTHFSHTLVGTHYSLTDQLLTVHRGQSPYQLGSSERSHPEPPAVCSRGRWIIRLTNTHTHACIHTHTHTQ